MRSPRRLHGLTLAAACALSVAFVGGEKRAQAEPSAWASVGLGGVALEWAGQPRLGKLQMPIDAGFGLPASFPVIVGAGVRLGEIFGEGPDWAAYARLATRSYVTGYWGFALDAGGYSRAFGIGSSGYLVTGNIGGPWGFVAALNFENGTNASRTFGAVLAIDFLRLTIYRLANQQEWPNINPAYRPDPPPTH